MPAAAAVMQGLGRAPGETMALATLIGERRGLEVFLSRCPSGKFLWSHLRSRRHLFRRSA